MSWWKSPKCPVCKKRLKKGQPLHELQLQTAEGPHSLEICGECANFFDKSADAIINNRKSQFDGYRNKKQADFEES